jgi:hypothetical protein
MRAIADPRASTGFDAHTAALFEEPFHVLSRIGRRVLWGKCHDDSDAGDHKRGAKSIRSPVERLLIDDPCADGVGDEYEQD